MRRTVGDEAWEALPDATRREREAEGVALVEEIADIVDTPPWDPGRITVPVIAMYGEHSREHHRDGSFLLAELLSSGDPVAIAGAGHLGPSTHAEAVAGVLATLAAATS
jgi:pimeloyl-ACP methyl ester carboxylesterase